MSTKITEVNVATVVMKLPRALQLGAMTVERREYAAVEIVTAGGQRGKAYCLTRETPMAEIVQRVFADNLIDEVVENIPELWDSLYRASAIVGRVGLVRRALGLVDIALWDIASQSNGISLSSHLAKQPCHVKPKLATTGVPRPSERALLVAAYPTSDRSAREVANEVLAHAAHGWSLLKIARSPDTVLMRQLLQILAAELPPGCEVIVDVGFGWKDADQALVEIAQWGNVSLAWLEDPLLPEDLEGIARIRRETGLHIAVGDEVTDPELLHRLVDFGAIDVMRLDVVALGGITPSLELIQWANEKPIPISGHIYPEVTVHLGIGVETFPRNAGPYDPSPSFIIGGPTFRSGLVSPSTAAGLGFTLDPDLFHFSRD